MKHILFSLLTALVAATIVAAPITAQDDDTQIVRPLSQRYEFTVPAEWVVTTSSSLFDPNHGPLSEVVLAADRTETMDFLNTLETDDENEEDINVFNAQFDGSHITVSILPSLEEDFPKWTATQWADGFAELFEEEYVDDNATIERYAVDLSTIDGVAIEIVRSDEKMILVVIFLDSQQNMIVFVGSSDLKDRELIDDALQSFYYVEVPESDLLSLEQPTTAIPIVEKFLAVNVPIGWWSYEIYNNEGLNILLPDIHMLERIPPGAPASYPYLTSMVEESMYGIGFLAVSIPFSSFDDAAYQSEDGTLNLEAYILDQGSAENMIFVEEWESSSDLSGIKFAVQDTHNEITRMGLVVEGEEAVYSVVGITPTDRWPEYESFIEAILDSAHRIDEH